VSLCLTTTIARDTCSPVVYKTVFPDSSKSEISWAWNTSLPSGIPPGTLFNLYPQGRAQTDSTGISRGSWTIEDVNGNTTEVRQYDWASVLAHDPNGLLETISCATGVTVCPMQQMDYEYRYTVPGTTTYWLQVGTTGTQRFLRALSTVTLNSVPLISLSYVDGGGDDEYATTGNVTQISNWDSVTSGWISQALAYTGHGNVTTSTDPKGYSTVTCYDGNDLYPVTQVAAASSTSCPSPGELTEGQKTTLTYDFNSGVVTGETDSDNSINNSYSYDNLGRQISATEAAGALSRTTLTAYDDVGLSVTTTQSDTSTNLVSTTYYDPLGRVRRVQDGAGDIQVSAYRSVSGTGSYQLQSNPYVTGGGGTILTADGTMGWTRTLYDTLGRAEEVDHYQGSTPPSPWTTTSVPLTGTSTVAYDQTLASCTGPVTTVTDDAVNQRSNCQDGLGRLVSVTEPPALTGVPAVLTTYGYDMLGNLSTVDSTGASYSCGSGHLRTFTYSTLSRLTSACNPESGATQYFYDLNGNLTQRKDANTNVTNVDGYDGLNRPGSISYTLNASSYTTNSVTYSIAATPTVSYVYDADFKGALTSVSNSVGSTSYAHDAFGRIASSTQTVGTTPHMFNYGYSLTDTLTYMKYPSGREVNYALDAADRVTTVQNVTGGGSYATAAYTPAGAALTNRAQIGIARNLARPPARPFGQISFGQCL